MGLFTFFKRPTPGATPGASAALDVDAARTRARRRLIGAVLLLGIGVIAFPVLFETQPRPIPVDLPIEIPRKEGAAPLTLPAARPIAPAPAPVPVPVAAQPAPAAPVLTETKADAGKEIAASAPKPAPTSAAPPLPVKPAPVAVPAAQPKTDAPPSAEAPGRFVVQVGAFADTALAREARAKVDKLGLRTYTQVVETDAGKRIRVRVGPFGSREEAEQSAAKVKAAGLPAAVLTL